MGWWQDYISWVKSTNKENNAAIAEASRLREARLAINRAMTLADLEAAWSTIPADLQTNTEIKGMYETRKKNVPIDPVTLSGIISGLAAKAETALIDVMNQMKVTPISKARETTMSLLAADAAFQISVGAAGIVAEIAGAGQIDTFTDFQKFLRARTGYGGPITMLMKAPVEMALIKPLSYSLHSTFRNELPPFWDIADMDVKGNLTATGALSGFASGIFGMGKAAETNKNIFDAVGGYAGYEQWYLDAKWDSRWRELRLGEIAWALSDSLVDDDELKRMLSYAKYAPADRPIIIKFIKARYLRPYRDRVASQFRNEYKEGYISAQNFRLKLAELEIPLEVRNLMIFEADALFRLDMHADQIAAWEAQYLKTPTMTDAELRALYGKIIVDPARIEPRIEKLRAQRYKTPALPKPVTQGARVSSSPNYAKILLDFIDTGKLTPETVETSAGTHKITVSAAGYEPYSEEFTAKEGEFVDVHTTLAIPLIPEDEKLVVWWIDQYLKTPTMTDSVLRAQLTSIIRDPARVEPRIADAIAQRKILLAPEKIQKQGVRVSSKPSNAYIFLDDAATGKLSPETVETSAGTHTLTISAEGYESYTAKFTIAKGEFAEIYAVLVPLPELAE